jgi:uncharacterized protein YebE (UPF0316 family)
MEIIVLALLAMSSVCLWTLRLAVTTRGHRLLAPPLAAVEAIVYVTAFGRLLTDLGSIERRLAFGLGVAAGTYVAMIVADRVTPVAVGTTVRDRVAVADRSGAFQVDADPDSHRT